MPINANKTDQWKADTRASVDQFNQWFMKFAPRAYRETRKKTIESVEQGLALTKDLTTITADVIKANPDFAHVYVPAAGPRSAHRSCGFNQEFCGLP
jgi:hypothetical protein